MNKDMNKLTRKVIKTGKVSWNHFTYDGILSEDEAAKVQMDIDYHPAGYGFYSYAVKDGKTTWQCSTSCD